MAIDNREVVMFVRDLSRASKGIAREVSQVVKKGAVNIKTEARARISSQLRGNGHAKRYASHIGFDMEGDYTAVIGPSREGQGELGVILEYGTPYSSAHPHLNPALDSEIPRFTKALGDVVGTLNH